MAANIYETGGAVIGYLTAGSDPTKIAGVVDKIVNGGAALGKFVVAPHVNGTYDIIKIDAVQASPNPNKVAFTAHVDAQAVNFVPKPFSTVQSALNTVTNELNVLVPAADGKLPILPLVAGAGVLVLLLSRGQ